MKYLQLLFFSLFLIGCSASASNEVHGVYDPEGLDLDLSLSDEVMDREVDREIREVRPEAFVEFGYAYKDAYEAFNEDDPLNSDFEVFAEIYYDIKFFVFYNLGNELTGYENNLYMDLSMLGITAHEIVSTEDSEKRERLAEILGSSIDRIGDDLIRYNNES